MSTITKEFTKEQLTGIIAAVDDLSEALEEDRKSGLINRKVVERWDFLNDRAAPPEVVKRLAEIALASLEAEEVADVVAWSSPNEERTCDVRLRRHDINAGPLYTAPPAPVSDEDLLHMAASAIDDLLSNKDRSGAGVWADIPAKLRRAAMLQGADGNSPVIPDCSCHACRPVTFADSRFVVCPVCGNKRCPHANDHRNACTGSNEPGQEGSAYPAAPQQEAKP
ncbi:TPA: hypothetical protein QCH82_004165 [Enterobacter kobei]|nr:hypothetical protein [Enterobacter kobei]